MLKTLYSFQEINIYNKMIRLLMYDGKKDKALVLFFETLTKLMQKIEQSKKKSLHYRAYRIFERTRNPNHLVSLGFKSHRIVRSAFYSIDVSCNKHMIGNNDLDAIDTREKNSKAQQGQKMSQAFSILHQSVQNVLPYLEVRKVRISGKTRQIPSMIGKNRQQTLALRHLIEGARKRKKSHMTFSDCLALEFLEAYEKQGSARRKRNELHKIAHANRTFLRYRWW